MSDYDFSHDGIEAYGQLGMDLPADVTEAATLDVIFEALSHRRRRFALYCLMQLPDGVAELSPLVEAVRTIEGAADEVEAPPPAGSVETDLHHVHLPKLAQAGFVDYDRRQGTVRYEQVPALEEWVDHARYKEVGAPHGQ